MQLGDISSGSSEEATDEIRNKFLNEARSRSEKMFGLRVIEWEEYSRTAYFPESLEELFDNPPKEPEYIVNPFFPKGGVNMFLGESGAGKSWITMHLALCIASGNKFMGKYDVIPGKVLIIDEENALPLIFDRLCKLGLGMLSENQELSLSNILLLENNGIRVDDEEHFAKLRSTIADTKPSLVIMDSLIRIHSKDENSANEMSEVFHLIKKLKHQPDTTFVITHHLRKSGGPLKLRGRGSGDIIGSPDSQMTIENKGTYSILTQTKTRWTKEETKVNFNIVDSPDETATYIRCLDGVPKEEQPTRTRKATKKEKIKDFIRKALFTQDREREDMISSLEPIASRTTILNAIKEMKKDEEIDQDGEQGTKVTYKLME
ncbi:AAA family ATPase [Chloroflexota bacterium]